MQDADAVKAGETPARDQARIARRMIESSTRLGRHRWAYDTYITGPGETTTR